ncbi:MAG: FHA domain-containing protein, partial [Pseudomonadota bacterium]
MPDSQRQRNSKRTRPDTPRQNRSLNGSFVDDAPEYTPTKEHVPSSVKIELSDDEILEVTSEELNVESTHVENQNGPNGSSLPLKSESTACLIVIGGNDRGREFILKEGNTVIGRDLDNDVVLSDIAVSRHHTTISKSGFAITVCDLDSGNGTWLNGKSIHTHSLCDGDQLELGNTLFRFLFPNAPSMETSKDSPNAPTDVEKVAPPPTIDVRRKKKPTYLSKGRQISRSKKLIVWGGGGLVVFFATMIAIKAFWVLPSSHDSKALSVEQTRQDEIAAKLFDEGTRQYRARDWKNARKQYLRVLAIAPSFDKAREYADQATNELAAQNAIASAKASLATENYDAAHKELSKVPT